MNIYSDISKARLVHVGWELGLERLLSGYKALQDPKIHAECGLGRWIRERGQAKYESYGELDTLLNVHEKFHSLADEIISRKEQGHTDIPSEIVMKMHKCSREVVYLLTRLELSVRMDKKDFTPLTHAFRGLKVLLGGNLGGDPFRMAPRPRMMDWLSFDVLRRRSLAAAIDINAARLNHMLWARDLELVLGSLGGVARQRQVPDADECYLGSWLNGAAREDIEDDSLLKILSATHKEFHTQVIKAISSLRHDDDAAVHDSINEINGLSRDLVLAMTHAEFKAARRVL